MPGAIDSFMNRSMSIRYPQRGARIHLYTSITSLGSYMYSRFIPPWNLFRCMSNFSQCCYILMTSTNALWILIKIIQYFFSLNPIIIYGIYFIWRNILFHTFLNQQCRPIHHFNFMQKIILKKIVIGIDRLY